MINVKRYVIDYVKLVTQRVPIDLRFDDLMAYLMALVGPLVYLYNKLLAFRDSIIYKLTITPQVAYLEKMLNDRYDNALRRIYIEDGESTNAIPLYTKAELQPVILYTKGENQPISLYTKGEAGQFTFDFVVWVPLGLTFDETEMTALVNTYKLVSKFFKIQTF